MTDTKTKVQRNGQDTSWDAALLQTSAKSAVLYDRIRDYLTTRGPQTDEELLAGLRRVYAREKFTDSGVRSRRNELVLSGWVTKARTDDGQVLKRQGANGSPRIVWRAVAEGEVVEVPTTNGERATTDWTHIDGAPVGWEYRRDGNEVQFRNVNTPKQGEPVLVQRRDHEAGLAAARRYAGWNIGDKSWANLLVGTYLNPEQTMAELDADGAPA